MEPRGHVLVSAGFTIALAVGLFAVPTLSTVGYLVVGVLVLASASSTGVLVYRVTRRTPPVRIPVKAAPADLPLRLSSPRMKARPRLR